MLKNKYFSYLIIGVLMAGIFVLITNIQLVFQKNHNFHFDPAFYQYKNTITYLHFKENGFIETIGFILTHVRNNPLYHIVLLTIKPNLLSLPNGHLLLNFLIYSLFIFLVYEYTRFLGFTFFVRILIITMIIFLRRIWKMHLTMVNTAQPILWILGTRPIGYIFGIQVSPC